jgi:hypothetical protein
MSVKLAVAGRPPLVLDDEYITLGSDPGCVVTFPDTPDVKSKHAVIHLVAGRWLIEVRQAESFLVGGKEAKQMHWLSPGDVIQLSENGPQLVFQLTSPEKHADAADAPLLVVHESSPKSTLDPLDLPLRLASDDAPVRSSVPPLSDSDPIVPVVTKPAAPSKPKAPKPPSSVIIPTAKPQSASKDSIDQVRLPPISGTIKTTKPPSSTVIPTQKSNSEIKKPPSTSKDSIDQVRLPPLSGTIKTTKSPSSAVIPTQKSNAETKRPPSSTTIRTTKSLSSDSIPAGGKKKKSDSQASVHDSDGQEPEAKLPVLKRITHYEEPVVEVAEDGTDGWDGVSPIRRGKRGDDFDIQFIKTVVIRCALVVVALIILFHVFRESIRAFNPPNTVPSTTSIVMPHECHVA